MCKCIRSVTLVYFLVGLMLIAGSLGCCCGWDRKSCHNVHLHHDCKSLRNVVTSVKKRDNVIQLHTLSDNQITAHEAFDLPVEIINKIIIEEEEKKDVQKNNADKCAPTCKVKETVATIPYKIFIDGKEIKDSNTIIIKKGEKKKVIVESEDHDLSISTDREKIVDISIGEINMKKKNRVITLKGEHRGKTAITFCNNRGGKAEIKVKVITPLKVFEIGGVEIDENNTFSINKCIKRGIAVESDGPKPEIIRNYKVDKNEEEKIDISALMKNEISGVWETTLLANESAKISEIFKIRFKNTRGEGDATITVKVE